MTALGGLLFFIVAAGADGIVARFGWPALYMAVAVCGVMVLGGEVVGRVREAYFHHAR